MRTAADIAALVGAGELDPVAVVEDALERIAGDADLNAIMVTNGERALARARAGVRGRLAGVPLLVKDLIDVEGLRITYGSKVYADHVASDTAPCVRALEAEGAIVVATTTCDEFAWGVGGQNPHWGDTGNPAHPGRTIATDLVNPDFVALARAYGAHGERIEHAAAFPEALQRARTCGGPALIELATDPEALTPSASLSQIRNETLNPPEGV